jgi:hypothetical protein
MYVYINVYRIYVAETIKKMHDHWERKSPPFGGLNHAGCHPTALGSHPPLSVGLTQVQVADAGFNLAHIANVHPAGCPSASPAENHTCPTGFTLFPTERLANPRNLRDNNNLPSMSGRQSGKDSVQLC